MMFSDQSEQWEMVHDAYKTYQGNRLRPIIRSNLNALLSAIYAYFSIDVFPYVQNDTPINCCNAFAANINRLIREVPAFSDMDALDRMTHGMHDIYWLRVIDPALIQMFDLMVALQSPESLVEADR
jgi:hypothetical protein